MAFLLSSAVTDPSLFAITMTTLGWSFAVGKTLAALGIGLVGGGVTFALVRGGWFAQPMRQFSLLQSVLATSQCTESAQTDVRWRFWQESRRLAVFRRTCWGMVKLVLMFLGAAFFAEYFLKLYLPAGALTDVVGQDSSFAIPIAAMVAAPLYLDGYAALPLVRGLLEHGMADGAAMAFLISGGIVSLWTALPVFALVRLPVFLGYVVMACRRSDALWLGICVCSWMKWRYAV